MTPLQFTRNVRSLNRLRRIAYVLTQHGFGHIVARIDLGRFVPVWMMRRSQRETRLADTPSSIGRHIAEVCAELGPTFIKFAQLLTSRPDIVPEDVLQGLRQLQDDVPPFDSSTAMQLIADELGKPIEDCYASIEPTPIASGSIGQVYRAVGHDGRQLVIKVQRPDVADVIKVDMQLLHWLSESLESLIPELNTYRPTLLVSELENMLTREIDYIGEASATAKFARKFADTEGINIPTVIWDLCSSKVLTLTAVPGVNVEVVLRELGEKRQSFNRQRAAKQLTDCFMQQVFELGVFHADPHPGNVLIDEHGQIGLIDFGQTGTITEELMTELIVIVYAAVNNQIDVIIDALADLGALGPETDRRQLARALQTLLDKYYGLPIKRIDLGVIMNEFTDVVRQHDVITPRDLLMLFKTLALVSSVVAQLDPELNMLELLAVRLKKVTKERLSPARLAKESAVWSWHLFSIARQAPRQLREMMRGLSTGKWRLHVRHENIDKLINELDRSSNRLAFSIVIAAIIVGSSVVISAGTTLTVFDIKVQYFGIVGYLIAGVLGLGLSWAIYRSGRLH